MITLPVSRRLLIATVLTTLPLAVLADPIDQNVGDFEIVADSGASPAQAGDLTVSGAGYFEGGIFGLGIATGLNDAGLTIYYGELSGEAYVEFMAGFEDTNYIWYQEWGDVKMWLDNDNILSLYNTSGVSKIVLDPNNLSITIDGQAVLRTNSSGRVGIGTSSPNEQLEITGNFRIPATSGSSAGVIYQGANRFLHSKGTESVFLGENAGNFTNTGNDNIGIGSAAVDSLTSGAANVAIGSDALTAATTAGYSVAVGYDALASATTGSSNVAVGAAALKGLTSGWFNTGVGQYALYSFNSGNTTALGYAAGMWATGHGSTYIGTLAGESITTGELNAALGYKALDDDGTGNATTNGNLRTAIGAYAQVTANNTIAMGGLGSYASDVIMGGTAASAKLHVVKTTEQVRVAYDGSNYYSTTVGSTGGVTFNAVGSGSGFTFSNDVTMGSDTTLRVPERGDLSMGAFTAGP